MIRSVFLIMLLIPLSATAKPVFNNSVVSNDIEFLKTSDKSSFYCLRYFGTDKKEMPDKRSDKLMAEGVHNFEAWFQDGTKVGIWAHPDLGKRAAAEAIVRKITDPLGRLPSFMRKKLNHVVVHKGNETAFAEDQGRFFVLYNENIKKRIQTHDIEETVFHESVHATLDIPLASSSGWLAAQAADNDFITKYAASEPDGEDLAETALFAYTYFQHPNRLPVNVRSKMVKVIPNRLAFLKKYFDPSIEMQHVADNLKECKN